MIVQRSRADNAAGEDEHGDVALVVSIIIPTFERQRRLAAALRSCAVQRGIGPEAMEIIVVDNAATGSAADTVAAVAAEFQEGPRIVYVHEPRPGISHARNRGLRASIGGLILFLDDDQVASPDLVAIYRDALRKSGADALFGPVEAVAEDGRDVPAWIRAYHCREGRREWAPLIKKKQAAGLGTSNSLFVRASCMLGPHPFDAALGTTGGEDTLFLRQLLRQRRVFAWAEDARVIEFVSPARLTSDFVKWRRFRSGQIRTLTCLRLSPPERLEAAFWMGIGAIQVVAFSVLAAMLRLAGSDRWQAASARAYGGAGKVMWMDRFLFHAYGVDSHLPR